MWPKQPLIGEPEERGRGFENEGGVARFVNQPPLVCPLRASETWRGRALGGSGRGLAPAPSLKAQMGSIGELFLDGYIRFGRTTQRPVRVKKSWCKHHVLSEQTWKTTKQQAAGLFQSTVANYKGFPEVNPGGLNLR